MDLSLVCAGGFLVSVLAHLYLMPPPHLKAPQRTRLLGRLTYLTVQSNVISFLYHAFCLLVPDSPLVIRLHPLVFGLGFALTPLYYGLDHYQAEKAASDREWIAKGWRWIPLGNHLEHGLALPLALLDGLCTVRATPASADVLRFCGGYGAAYFVLVVLQNKRRTGWWVYPVFEELERAFGMAGPCMLGGGVSVAFVGLGFLDQALS